MERPPLRPGSASISGRVVDAVTEKPVVNAEVQLSEIEQTTESTATSIRRFYRSATARTNAAGNFTFSKVAAGSYRILVISKTHLPACFGSSRQLMGPCAEITLADADEQRDIVVFARPGAIIKGRILDHEGAPMLGGTVRVTLPDRDLPIGFANPMTEGRFEIGGLAAGQVLLSIEMLGKHGEGLVRAYYPGVLRQNDATPLNIEVGTTTEVELRVPRITVGSIVAHVWGPDGFRLDKLTMTRPDTKTYLTLTREDDGTARVINLREGRYVIEARGSVNGKPLAAFATAEVGDAESDVPINLADAAVVVGRVVAERGGLPPLGGVRVAAVWMLDGVEADPMRSDEIDVGADGAFSFNGLFGTRVFQVIGLDAAWHVVSIRAGRSDITGQHYDIAGGSRIDMSIVVGRR